MPSLVSVSAMGNNWFSPKISAEVLPFPSCAFVSGMLVKLLNQFVIKKEEGGKSGKQDHRLHIAQCSPADTVWSSSL